MDTPVLIIAPLFATLIIYFAVGLEVTFQQFILFYVTLLMQAQVAASIGYFVSSIFENE